MLPGYDSLCDGYKIRSVKEKTLMSRILRNPNFPETTRRGSQRGLNKNFSLMCTAKKQPKREALRKWNLGLYGKYKMVTSLHSAIPLKCPQIASIYRCLTKPNGLSFQSAQFNDNQGSGQRMRSEPEESMEYK